MAIVENSSKMNFLIYGKKLRKETEVASIVAALLATIGFAGVFSPPTFLVDFYENSDALQGAGKTPKQGFFAIYFLCVAVTALLSMIALAANNTLLYLLNLTEENGKDMECIRDKFPLIEFGETKWINRRAEDLVTLQGVCVRVSTFLLGLAVLLTAWSKYYLYLWAKVLLSVMYVVFSLLWFIVVSLLGKRQYTNTFIEPPDQDIENQQNNNLDIFDY